MTTPYYNASSGGGQQPVVVQGTLVNNPPIGHIYDHKHANHGVGAMEISDPSQQKKDPLVVNNNEEVAMGNWTKGEVQPRRCNDILWALLFYAHLAVMGGCAAVFAPRMFGEVAQAAVNGSGGGERDLMIEDEGENAQDERVGIKTMMIRGTYHLVTAMTSLYPSNNDEEQHRTLQENDDVTGTNDMGDMMLLLGISALLALVISTGALSFMIRHAESLIKFALLFNIGATFLVSEQKNCTNAPVYGHY